MGINFTLRIQILKMWDSKNIALYGKGGVISDTADFCHSGTGSDPQCTEWLVGFSNNRKKKRKTTNQRVQAQTRFNWLCARCPSRLLFRNVATFPDLSEELAGLLLIVMMAQTTEISSTCNKLELPFNWRRQMIIFCCCLQSREIMGTRSDRFG